MSGRSGRLLFVTLVAGTLTACATASTGRGDAGRNGTWAEPSAAASSASPRPNQDELKVRAQAGTVSPTGMGALKLGRAEIDHAGLLYSVDACGVNVKGELGEPVGSYQRIWPGDTASLNEIVRAHAYTPGATIVTKARTIGSGCQDYTENGHTWKAYGEVKLPSLAGIDAAYAYCEKWDTANGGVWRCRAYLGRGTVPDRGGLVAMVIGQSAYGKTPASKLMTDGVNIAAPVLARA